MEKTDREQIQEVMARYANAIDAKDYSALMELFTPDATAKYGTHSHLLTGASAIEAHMRKILDPLDGTQHLLTNFIIDIQGDTAQLSADTQGQHWRTGRSGIETNMGGGKYKVQLRRVGGKWKLASIMTRSLWSTGTKELVPHVE